MFGEITAMAMEQFEEEFNSNDILQNYMRLEKYEFVKLLAAGQSAWIFITSKNKKKYTFKLEKKNSTRRQMVEKETRHLKIANEEKIGFKLVSFDLENRFLIYEYEEGIPFNLWIVKLEMKDKKILEKCLKELEKQAKKLDEIGLDHGQLAGTGSNIIVKENGTPIIVDFEKGSIKRKPHNYNVLKSFLYNKNSEIGNKIIHILELKN
jgi:predicted Ser/Thr protein kinase